MLFDLSHSLYIVISSVITFGLIVLFYFCIKEQKSKDFILKIAAICTVIIHFSSLYVDYFTTGEAKVDSTMLLPIYPCNVAMWLLVISAFWKNKQSKLFDYIAEFTFYLGITGGIIGILFNENYASTPNLADWDILKGLLSHSVMLLGCTYLLTGGYIKIRVRNVLSVLGGLIFLLIDGGIIIGLYYAANLQPPNCMYLLKNPFPNVSWFNTYIIGIFALIIVFVITALIEQMTLSKDERWYMKLKNLKNKKENLK